MLLVLCVVFFFCFFFICAHKPIHFYAHSLIYNVLVFGLVDVCIFVSKGIVHRSFAHERIIHVRFSSIYTMFEQYLVVAVDAINQIHFESLKNGKLSTLTAAAAAAAERERVCDFWFHNFQVISH